MSTPRKRGSFKAQTKNTLILDDREIWSVTIHFRPLIQLLLQILPGHFGLKAQRVPHQVDALVAAVDQRKISCRNTEKEGIAEIHYSTPSSVTCCLLLTRRQVCNFGHMKVLPEMPQLIMLVEV